jgi:hypothetical protein
MYPRLSTILVALLGGFGPSSGEAQVGSEILLRVRVTDAAYTDHAPDDCPSGAECVAGNSWFRYEAKVREVVQGGYGHGTVRFANLQHAYFAPRHPHNWYVLLVSCGESVKIAVGVDYCVKDHAFGHAP